VALLLSNGHAKSNLVLWTIGFLIFLVGMFGRIWAQEHLHYRLKVPLTFTRTGPYAWIRNPIYVSNTLMFVGLVVVIQSSLAGSNNNIVERDILMVWYAKKKRGF
jgi:protein-S-isoprenylcysteine O-methyltransferase Ste14